MFSEIPEFVIFGQKRVFHNNIRKFVFQLIISSFIPKSYSENRFQIRTAINEVHAFKLFLYGIYILGVILSKL